MTRSCTAASTTPASTCSGARFFMVSSRSRSRCRRGVPHVAAVGRMMRTWARLDLRSNRQAGHPKTDAHDWESFRNRFNAVDLGISGAAAMVNTRSWRRKPNTRFPLFWKLHLHENLNEIGQIPPHLRRRRREGEIESGRRRDWKKESKGSAGSVHEHSGDCDGGREGKDFPSTGV